MFYLNESHNDLLFLTILPSEGEEKGESAIRSVYGRLVDFLETNGASLLQERVYCRLPIADLIERIRKETFSRLSTKQIPATCVEGLPLDGTDFAGIHAIAVRVAEENPSWLIERENQICGRVFHGREAQYLSLPDVARLVPKSLRSGRGKETDEAIKLTETILKEADWSFHNVCRTWFYLDEILEWYGDFNHIRNAIYERIGFFNGNPNVVIPASTGIYGKNANGNACTLDVLAIRSHNGRPLEFKRMVNARQNEATDYGSAFSRGITIHTDSAACMFISGTASIDESGKTIHLGDMKRQTERTFQNIETLLDGLGAEMKDIVQATAFVKFPEDAETFYQVRREMKLENVPMICTVADVCRDDLLFELDATAIMPIC